MTLTPEQVASYAAAAGFSGEALVTMVAIAGRESGNNPEAVGDADLAGIVWGPSVGLTQIRTLRAETGTGADRDIDALLPGGHGDPARQMAASWNISGGGTDFTPWTTYRLLSTADLEGATGAANAAAPGTVPAPGGGGISGVLTGGIAGAVDKALLQVLDPLGIHASVFALLVETMVRTVETITGGILLAVALIMLLDVISGGASNGRRGIIGDTIAKAKPILTTIATAAK